MFARCSWFPIFLAFNVRYSLIILVKGKCILFHCTPSEYVSHGPLSIDLYLERVKSMCLNMDGTTNSDSNKK